ncbi:MAG TPA: ABC transporter permease [Candidatus Limnocylindrales bacterium]|nr:ABC transporter permease [Candidatus Limnocylindrales bacterium]
MREGEPLLDLAWIERNLDQIADRLLQHLNLTLIAVISGFAMTFLLVLLIRRWRRLLRPLAASAAVIYTIPSLALFALLVPVFGLSLLTAQIALVGYTLFILLRTFVAGLDGVSADVREAAAGMGYSPWQSLWRVELPLALPQIVAGLRVATVTTIGLVTVAAFVGQGGLGQLILSGLRTFFATPVYVGALLSVGLAFAADLLLLRLERRLGGWSRAR